MEAMISFVSIEPQKAQGAAATVVAPSDEAADVWLIGKDVVGAVGHEVDNDMPRLLNRRAWCLGDGDRCRGGSGVG